MRLGMILVGVTLLGNGVGPRVFLQFIRTDRINPGGVEPEDLGAQRRSNLGIAVLGAQFWRDLKSAERLDLVLWRAVPDRIGAPEHVVLAAIFHQLADCMGRP